MPKLYLNCMLYVLNSRRSLRLVAEGGNTSASGDDRVTNKSRNHRVRACVRLLSFANSPRRNWEASVGLRCISTRSSCTILPTRRSRERSTARYDSEAVGVRGRYLD